MSEHIVQLLVIGAGARGNAYAQAIKQWTPNACISAIAEPIASKRDKFGQKYVWAGADGPAPSQSFTDWRDWLLWEQDRRRRANIVSGVPDGVDGVFICTLDGTHASIIAALAPLGVHIMSEKPLATTLLDCLSVYRCLQPGGPDTIPKIVFSVGHVLHYSPHNVLLRQLLLDDEAIGDTLSMEHTEPVGWWHFAHSYVRGNWRKESETAPSLLTKSCHDIDLLMWLLSSPPKTATSNHLHLPSEVASTGSLRYFKKTRKPGKAGAATNCYSCDAELDCLYSAQKVYVQRHLLGGQAGWPVNIVDAEIEDLFTAGKNDTSLERLNERLAEDYGVEDNQVEKRPWFGRCVYEAGNDVCDDQFVTITWEDDPLPQDSDVKTNHSVPIHGRGSKTASFHMVAFTEKQCQRRGRIYGTRGEIEYDSDMIRVFDFASGMSQTHYPKQMGGGHGGGDAGLAQAFIHAIEAVKYQNRSVAEAQELHIGCTLEDIVRNHAMVFAAEEARITKHVINWPSWWQENVIAASTMPIED